MGEHRLWAFGMVFRCVDSAAIRRAQHHGTPEPTARAIPQSRRMVRHLVEAWINESGELDLNDRAKALRRQPNSQACKNHLGKRGIEHALWAETVDQPFGYPKDATVPADILAEQDDTRILLHCARQRQVERADERALSHVSRHPRLRLPNAAARGRQAEPHRDDRTSRSAAVEGAQGMRRLPCRSLRSTRRACAPRSPCSRRPDW